MSWSRTYSLIETEAQPFLCFLISYPTPNKETLKFNNFCNGKNRFIYIKEYSVLITLLEISNDPNFDNHRRILCLKIFYLHSVTKMFN